MELAIRGLLDCGACTDEEMRAAATGSSQQIEVWNKLATSKAGLSLVSRG